MIKIQAQGIRYDDDLHSSCTSWVLIKGKHDVEDVKEFLELMGMHSHHGGPGHVFAKKPQIRQTKTRTLITQFVGLDI